MIIFLSILLVALAIALIVFVLFQTGGRSNKLSQAISGGSPDNYSGKNKQRSKDKKYAKITTVIAIVFAIVVVAFAMVMNYQYNQAGKEEETTTAEAVVDDTEADTAAESGAETEVEATETEAEATEAETEAAEAETAEETAEPAAEETEATGEETTAA